MSVRVQSANPVKPEPCWECVGRAWVRLPRSSYGIRIDAILLSHPNFTVVLCPRCNGSGQELR